MTTLKGRSQTHCGTHTRSHVMSVKCCGRHHFAFVVLLITCLSTMMVVYLL